MGFRPAAPVILSTLCHGKSAPERGYSPANHPAAQMLPCAASLENLHLRGENGTHRHNRTDGRREIPACAGAFFVDWPTTESRGNLCLRRVRTVVSLRPVRPRGNRGEEMNDRNEKDRTHLLEQSDRTKIPAEARTWARRSPNGGCQQTPNPFQRNDPRGTPRRATSRRATSQRGTPQWISVEAERSRTQ